MNKKSIVIGSVLGVIIIFGTVKLISNKPVVIELTPQQKIDAIVKELDIERSKTLKELDSRNDGIKSEINDRNNAIINNQNMIKQLSGDIEYNNTCRSIIEKSMGKVELIRWCKDINIEYPVVLSGNIETGFINNYPSYTPKPYDDPIVQLTRSSYYDGGGNEKPWNSTMERLKWKLNPQGASQGYIEIDPNKATIKERSEFILKEYGWKDGSFETWDQYSKAIGIKTEFAICLSKSETSLGTETKSTHNYFNCGNNDSGNTIEANNLQHNFNQLSVYCLNNKYMNMKTTLHHLYPNNPLSRCINKKNIPECKYVYASSPYNAGNNVLNCLSQIYDKEITMDYKFRLE